VVVENTHEAIVEPSAFKLVQELMEKKVSVNSPAGQTGHLLSGFIFCGIAGKDDFYCNAKWEYVCCLLGA
jgi:hypothetical protein